MREHNRRLGHSLLRTILTLFTRILEMVFGIYHSGSQVQGGLFYELELESMAKTQQRDKSNK